jgi:hypothetical protein
MESTPLLHWVLLLGVGVVSGYLNVLAGGGSVLTLPVLIFLGLDGALANGTNRVAILIQNIFSAAEFQRARGYPVKRALTYSLWTLPGAVAGAFFATSLSDGVFETVLGVVIIGVVITMMVPRGAILGGKQPEGVPPSPWIYPALLGIGFYGGFIQVGVGFLFMAALYHLLRLDLVSVNMHKVLIVLVYTVPALLIFMWSGDVDWALGLVLAAGSALGGWLAVKASIHGGEKVIRTALIAALLVMGAKLLNII